MTLLFFGSDDFSMRAFEACLESDHNILLVVTTPDQKKGRGLKLFPTPIKERALAEGLEVVAPDNLKDPDLIARVQGMDPDLFVVSSYGKFIPSTWLAIPNILSFNVHPSLLPKYRGASPINRPILNGDEKTGVTIMEVVSKLDSGDIFIQEEYSLSDTMDAATLSEVLADLSKPMVTQMLKNIVEDKVERTSQNDEDSTYADKLSKEEGVLSFQETAQDLNRKVRGLKPWPGTYLLFNGEPLIVDQTEVLDPQEAAPGTLLEICKDGAIAVATKDGVLKIERVKPAGKKMMNAADFIRGRRLSVGFVFDA